VLERLQHKFINLEQVVISGRFVRINCKEWVEFIVKAGKVKRMTVPVGINIPPFVLWGNHEKKEIMDICRDNSIHLLFV